MSKSSYKTVIVAVIYKEKQWQETKRNIQACNVPVIYVDRDGVGNLAKAYNQGFRKAQELYDFKYVWFVSNPTFGVNVFKTLVQNMDRTGYAAIHPSFNSDHKHLRPNGTGKIKPVQYIEFTAPIVRADIFSQFELDEEMPYWGMDLDWSYRVREAGHVVAVNYAIRIKHAYIRHTLLEPITKERHRLRKEANAATLDRIISIYGENWRDKLGYYQ